MFKNDNTCQNSKSANMRDVKFFFFFFNLLFFVFRGVVLFRYTHPVSHCVRYSLSYIS